MRQRVYIGLHAFPDSMNNQTEQVEEQQCKVDNKHASKIFQGKISKSGVIVYEIVYGVPNFHIFLIKIFALSFNAVVHPAG